MKREYFSHAVYNFVTPFDGENVVYTPSGDSLSSLIDKVYQGYDRDYINMMFDMIVAMRQVNEQEEKDRAQL